MAILTPDRWLSYLLHRIQLVMKEPFFDKFKVTSETQMLVCGLWALMFVLPIQQKSIWKQLCQLEASFTEWGNYLNSACWCCQFWFSDIATSPHVIFYVSLRGNLKQGASPALHRPSWRKPLEHINWRRRPFRTVSYYQALASRWKDEIFEFEYIIIDVLSERLKIPKTFTERDCSPKFYVTIIKQNSR